MRLKEGLQLRKIGSKHMIVNAADTEVNLAEVFTLNDTAAALWQRMEGRETEEEELAEWLCTKYDVQQEQALADVRRQLVQWKKFGLLLE